MSYIIYILFFRRLKGDVEKSLPGKEETLVEVELTQLQKRYYKAIFEKNVAFLSGLSTKKVYDNATTQHIVLKLVNLMY